MALLTQEQALKQTLALLGVTAAPIAGEPVIQHKPESALKLAAREALSRGFAIFPLQPRKKEPLPGSRGFKDAKTGEAALISWETIPDANIGIATGESDLCVLDFDNPLAVPEWVNETRTFKVRTGKGLHVYFKGARPSKKLHIGGDVVGDIKSTGGYVLGASSVHPSGAVYTVVDDSSIVPTPERISELFKSGEQPVNVSPNGPKIHRGSHDTELHRIAGKLRHDGLEEEAIYNALVEVVEKRCENYGSDYKEMCRKHAVNISKKPVGKDERVLFSGQETQHTAPALIASMPEANDEPEIEESELATRPVFPAWVMTGTSLFEGLVKPVVETSSKYPELVFMPGVVMLLNAVASQVHIKGHHFMPTLNLGLITPYGQYFKSSSMEIAQKYFGPGLVDTSKRHFAHMNELAQGKTMIASIGSSEGFGLAMQSINATKAVLYFDELSKFVDKSGIENSSFGADLLTFYESGEFGNVIKKKKESFTFQAGTYCFSWMWGTTDRAFPRLWSKLDNISSGLNDRMFFLLAPEKPRDAGFFTEPVLIEGAKRTKELLTKATQQSVYDYEDYASAQEKIKAFKDPRSIGLVERLALYFAIDLGLDSIDSECLDRAVALVKYRNSTLAFLDPIEAETRQGQLQQEITRELRRNGGKMPYRQLERDLHAARKGTGFWSDSFKGLELAGVIAYRPAKKGRASEQRPAMVYLLKQED
jgi:hypothetical protein